MPNEDELSCNVPEHEYDSSLGLRGDPIGGVPAPAEPFCNLPEHEYDSSLGLRGEPITAPAVRCAPDSGGYRQHVLDRIRHALIEGAESPALVANLAATFSQAEPTSPPTVPVVRIAGADIAVYMEDDGTLRFDVGRSPGCHVRKIKLTVDGYEMWGVALND